jgi:hypothetical protein
MAASHSHLFQVSVAVESEIRKIVMNHFLSDRTVLQWCPATGEDIATQMRLWCFHLSSNANSVSRPMTFSADSWITIRLNYSISTLTLFFKSLSLFIFVRHFLAFPLTFLCSKMTSSYQSCIANHKVIRGVGLQTRPRASFLDLSMKTSLQGWHMTWFYCEHHEPSLPPFVGRVPEF